jgi:excisionase family DNA binding protein
MASVAERREPRYGSAADLAAYCGVSVKTVRRLIDSGKVRGLKLGRRVVVPFEDLDSHLLRTQQARRPTMQATPTLTTPQAGGLPRLRFDERGHAIAPTEAELRGEAERIRQSLAEMDAIPDDPPGSDEEFWRAIDAGRPERPLFRGMY